MPRDRWSASLESSVHKIPLVNTFRSEQIWFLRAFVPPPGFTRVSTLYPHATTSITESKLDCALFFFPFQGTSYSFPLYFHLSSVLLLSFPLFPPFSPSQSFVLSTPTDIEFSSRRINFSFLLSAIPYWLMYPSVSSCSRFLFIVPRTPSIFRLAIGRFYFSLPVSAFHRTFPFYPSGIRRTRTR